MAAPAFAAHTPRRASIAAQPAVDCTTFAAHLPGHITFDIGLYGQKWLETPPSSEYLEPEVSPKRR